jgi:conjugal transfer pilus assembly protein TraE
MKLTRIKQTYDSVLAENKLHRNSNLLLVVALLFAVFGLMGKDAVVVLQPPTLSEEAEVGPNWASESYKTSWGIYLATLMGNVKPTNADFVKTAIEPLLDARIYQQTIELLDTQIQLIRRDRVSLEFEPQDVYYEKATNKVFIYGQSVLRGPTGKDTRERRTYEYEFNVTNYRPVLTYLDTYKEPPRTEETLEKEEKREKNKK